VIVVVGFMGAGKSTVGRLLAERTGLPFLDSDQVIEQRSGRAIRDIFAADGEPAFRQLEHTVIADLLDGPDAVLALGGGAVQDRRTRALLGRAHVIYLRASLPEVLSRVGSDPRRPMLQRPGLEELYRLRLAWYEEVSDLTVDTDGSAASAVVEQAMQSLPGLDREPGVRRPGRSAPGAGATSTAGP